MYGALPFCWLGWRVEGEESERIQASADFVFPADYVGFAGHFPEMPILPAIVQLAAVRWLAECAVGKKLAPLRYEKTKFKGMIGPDERVTVSIALAASPAGLPGTFKLTRADGVTAAAGSFVYIVESHLEGT